VRSSAEGGGPDSSCSDGRRLWRKLVFEMKKELSELRSRGEHWGGQTKKEKESQKG